MKWFVLPVGQYETNCVVVWNDPSKVWVIDPGADCARIMARLKKEGLSVGAVVLTHGHFDHISAVNAVLAESPPSPVYMHQKDEEFAFSILNRMPPYPETRRPTTLNAARQDGGVIICGGLAAKIFHTPGHTPGSWSLLFVVDKVLLTGDTLFKGSIGRTDFPGGNMDAMKKSLQTLMRLPDELRVIPGHGPQTILGHEKKNNPYLREVDCTQDEPEI